MRNVSAGWESTIRGSHKALVRARVCTSFQTGTAPTGTFVDVLAGNVTIDGTQSVRSTMDLTVSGADAWPKTGHNLLLAPYGNEVFLECGVQYSDDLVEYCSLGYFRIRTPSQDVAPDGPIRLDTQDRMAGIVAGRLVQPVQFLAGTQIGTVVSQLVTQIYPTAIIEWDDATNLIPLERSVITDQDRWAFLNTLITAHSKIWYWDHRGILVIKDLPSATTPVYTVDSGRDGVDASMKRSITSDGVYNGVVATGEGGDTQTPAFGLAVDNDPNSPTYWGGNFGEVPEYFSSPLLTTNAQCKAAAETILRKQLGLPYSVSFGTVPNVALEPYDCVLIRYSNRFGAEKHVLKALRIPLGRGQMTADTQEQTVILIGNNA